MKTGQLTLSGVTPSGVTPSGAELLLWRRGLLEAGGRPADLDWLLDRAAGVGWPQLQALRLQTNQPVLLSCSLLELERLWSRHQLFHEPLQYLVGGCSWRDLELAVAPGVLIPRAETELLVELAAACAQPGGPALWADLGTGSGCLAVALARLWPRGEGIAVDLSAEALRQAAANLEAHGLGDRVALVQGSWWAPLAGQAGRIHLVVANPPYIPTAVWQELEPLVREHEPSLALDGGADGLVAIRAIAAGAARHLAPGGWLLLEHHHDQSQAVLALLRQAGLVETSAHRDLEGRLRFAVARAVG
jgi:release factor glutamine methyltransferase